MSIKEVKSKEEQPTFEEGVAFEKGFKAAMEEALIYHLQRFLHHYSSEKYCAPLSTALEIVREKRGYGRSKPRERSE